MWTFGRVAIGSMTTMTRFGIGEVKNKASTHTVRLCTILAFILWSCKIFFWVGHEIMNDNWLDSVIKNGKEKKIFFLWYSAFPCLYVIWWVMESRAITIWFVQHHHPAPQAMSIGMKASQDGKTSSIMRNVFSWETKSSLVWNGTIIDALTMEPRPYASIAQLTRSPLLLQN